MNVFYFLFQFSKKYKKWFFVNIAATAIISVVDIYIGDYIKNLTDNTLYGAQQDIIKIIVTLVAVLAVGVVFKYIVGLASGKFGMYTIRDIRTALSKHIESLPISYFEASHSATMVTKLSSDCNTIQGLLQETIPGLLYNGLVFVFAFIYLFRLNWSMLVIAVAFTPITIYLINRLNRPLGKYAKGRQEGLESLTAIAQDTIGGAYIEKAYNLSNIMQQKFEQANDYALENTLKSQKRTAITNPLQVVIRWVPLVSCAIYGGYLAYNGTITAGSLLAFVLLLNYVVDPLASFPYMLGDIKVSATSVNRIRELLEQPIEFSGSESKVEASDIAFKLDNVCFNYNASVDVLKNISFDIAQNTSVAIVGSSGSGKTTLFKLLCGFYTPTSGSIELYDKKLEQLDIHFARELFSLVSQEVYLFPVSVAENISYGNPDATMDQVMYASKMANAEEFILKLPEGYNTLVGERGIKLSGGQRQRIAIARAFLKNAPILLLDEPTSALDLQSEALVQEALDRFMKDRTVIIIAHRLSTIKSVDQILVMDKGSIVEKGTHDELMAYDSVYSKLYSKQLIETDEAISV